MSLKFWPHKFFDEDVLKAHADGGIKAAADIIFKSGIAVLVATPTFIEPDWVYDFYNTAVVSSDNTFIRCQVKQKRYVFTKADISLCCVTTDTGLPAKRGHGDNSQNDALWKQFYGESERKSEGSKTNLNSQDYLLATVLNSVIHCKTGSENNVSFEVMWQMHLLIDEADVDWSSFVWEKLREFVEKAHKQLPYGRVITALIREKIVAEKGIPQEMPIMAALQFKNKSLSQFLNKLKKQGTPLKRKSSSRIQVEVAEDEPLQRKKKKKVAEDVFAEEEEADRSSSKTLSADVDTAPIRTLMAAVHNNPRNLPRRSAQRGIVINSNVQPAAPSSEPSALRAAVPISSIPSPIHSESRRVAESSMFFLMMRLFWDGLWNFNRRISLEPHAVPHNAALLRLMHLLFQRVVSSPVVLHADPAAEICRRLVYSERMLTSPLFRLLLVDLISRAINFSRSLNPLIAPLDVTFIAPPPPSTTVTAVEGYLPESLTAEQIHQRCLFEEIIQEENETLEGSAEHEQRTAEFQACLHASQSAADPSTSPAAPISTPLSAAEFQAQITVDQVFEELENADTTAVSTQSMVPFSAPAIVPVLPPLPPVADPSQAWIHTYLLQCMNLQQQQQQFMLQQQQQMILDSQQTQQQTLKEFTQSITALISPLVKKLSDDDKRGESSGKDKEKDADGKGKDKAE